MEVKEALLKRRSVRKFTLELVSDSDIKELMEAAMSGPSACNKRPWEFIIVKNKEKLEELKGATHYSKYDAPLAIIVCGNKSRFLPEPADSYWIQDCSAATENILLRAVDLGLGTCWCGVYPQKMNIKRVSEIFDLDENTIPLNIIYVGHPSENPEARTQYDEKLIKVIE